MMATGAVKWFEWFDDAKGFGFLTQDDGGENVFCQDTALEPNAFRIVAVGQKVRFDVITGPKGLHAMNVRPL